MVPLTVPDLHNRSDSNAHMQLFSLTEWQSLSLSEQHQVAWYGSVLGWQSLLLANSFAMAEPVAGKEQCAKPSLFHTDSPPVLSIKSNV